MPTMLFKFNEEIAKLARKWGIGCDELRKADKDWANRISYSLGFHDPETAVQGVCHLLAIESTCSNSISRTLRTARVEVKTLSEPRRSQLLDLISDIEDPVAAKPQRTKVLLARLRLALRHERARRWKRSRLQQYPPPPPRKWREVVIGDNEGPCIRKKKDAWIYDIPPGVLFGGSLSDLFHQIRMCNTASSELLCTDDQIEAAHHLLAVRSHVWHVTLVEDVFHPMLQQMQDLAETWFELIACSRNQLSALKPTGRDSVSPATGDFQEFQPEATSADQPEDTDGQALSAETVVAHISNLAAAKAIAAAPVAEAARIRVQPSEAPAEIESDVGLCGEEGDLDRVVEHGSASHAAESSPVPDILAQVSTCDGDMRGQDQDQASMNVPGCTELVVNGVPELNKWEVVCNPSGSTITKSKGKIWRCLLALCATLEPNGHFNRNDYLKMAGYGDRSDPEKRINQCMSLMKEKAGVICELEDHEQAVAKGLKVSMPDDLRKELIKKIQGWKPVGRRKKQGQGVLSDAIKDK